MKCCGFQELGSVGEDGKAKRGRYLMSSQNDAVVDFFPPLSIEIPNDTALLPIVPLYTRLKTYANYVYHNSKYTGTKAKHPRNEYRIYLNNEMEAHQLYLKAEDIVVMRKSMLSSLSEFDGEQCVYYLDVVKDHSSALYLMLNRIIEDYPIKGGYGMYDGELEFFEDQVNDFEAKIQLLWYLKVETGKIFRSVLVRTVSFTKHGLVMMEISRHERLIQDIEIISIISIIVYQLLERMLDFSHSRMILCLPAQKHSRTVRWEMQYLHFWGIIWARLY